MAIQTVVNCLVIFIGSIILMVCIFKAKKLLIAIPFVPKVHQKRIKSYLMLHRILMVFFLLGYYVVLFAFAFNYSLVSETFVSIIFLFGAIFVIIGIYVQLRLMSEVHSTLQGILPICSGCKKIKVQEGQSQDQQAWKEIESYISERADVDFSHGFCPDCFKQEMKNLE
jgi:hypothetical protein